MFLCGIIFLVLGVAYLLMNMGMISANLFNNVVALLAIIVGLKCLLKKKGGHHGCCDEKHAHGGE